VIKKPQRRKPRPDLGCTAVGWMDGWMDEYEYHYAFYASHQKFLATLY
jgi:hypothetical protein